MIIDRNVIKKYFQIFAALTVYFQQIHSQKPLPFAKGKNHRRKFIHSEALDMNTKYCTVQQIAVELGVSYDTVRYMIHSGQLKAFKVGTGKTRSSYRITEEAFQQYKRGEVKS